MFEKFINRKIQEYWKQAEFAFSGAAGISLHKLYQSNLPPYIINFLEQSATDKDSISRQEFERTLRRAIVFNINYVIKPRATLLKFLFGSADARSADYITQRLTYFQFYRYYIDAIREFIQLRQPPIVSVSQVEKILDEVNKKILAEITSDASSDTQRLNLIKLLYHFFMDLTENNPINIKLPKSILSSFFRDKQFYELKKRTDSFFKEDIFIQEALELMKRKKGGHKQEEIPEDSAAGGSPRFSTPGGTLPGRERGAVGNKTNLLLKSGVITEEINNATPSPAPESDTRLYSDELMEASSATTMFVSHGAEHPESPEEKKKKLLEDLFCEPQYRKQILKKLFRKDEKKFTEFVYKLLDINSWDSACDFIDDFFAKNKLDYLSEEAVKFVDIMEGYFVYRQR